MQSTIFVEELEALTEAQLSQLAGNASSSAEAAEHADVIGLLRVALANEMSVSELAAFWMPSTAEWDIKIALAQQAGDEARHFTLVEGRLKALGVSLSDFAPAAENPLFAYLRSLRAPVEKIAAGQFTLEMLAYKVNQNFMRYCRQVGDEETVRLYQRVIQPEERRHQQMGKQLLLKYATTAEAQRAARDAAARTLELAAAARQRAAQQLGRQCLPGC